MIAAENPALMGSVDPDETMNRKLDEVLATLTKKPALPPWLVPLCMYLIGHLVGSIWWAATMQSNVTYLQQDSLRSWQKIETHDLQLGKLDSIVRAAVKEAMHDANYVRVSKKGDD